MWCGARCGKLWLISCGWLSERQCFRDAWMQVTAHTVTVNSLIESNKQTKSRARVFQSHSQYRKKLLFYLHDYKITFAESSRVIFQIAYDLEWNPLIDLLVTGLNKDKALRWREARV
jgi:hypothetical protein